MRKSDVQGCVNVSPGLRQWWEAKGKLCSKAGVFNLLVLIWSGPAGSLQGGGALNNSMFLFSSLGWLHFPKGKKVSPFTSHQPYESPVKWFVQQEIEFISFPIRVWCFPVQPHFIGFFRKQNLLLCAYVWVCEVCTKEHLWGG
jgi:hypothetical protein